MSQWQPTICRVAEANIDNKHITTKETESLQSKVMSVKHLFKNIPAGFSVNVMVFLEHFN